MSARPDCARIAAVKVTAQWAALLPSVIEFISHFVQAQNQPIGLFTRGIARERIFAIRNALSDHRRGQPAVLSENAMDSHTPSFVRYGVLFQEQGAAFIELEGNLKPSHI